MYYAAKKMYLNEYVEKVFTFFPFYNQIFVLNHKTIDKIPSLKCLIIFLPKVLTFIILCFKEQ